MEDRTLLTAFSVSNTADAGLGSLRQAILDSNAASGQVNTIQFAIPGQGVQTIGLLSPLPTITNSLVIDGSSEPGYSGKALIALGHAAFTTAPLVIASPDVTIADLAIDRVAISTSTDGLLFAQVHGLGVTNRLSLLDSEGQVLVQSDGVSESNPDDVIDQHITVGTYGLAVQALAGSGTFRSRRHSLRRRDPNQSVALLPAASAIAAPVAVGDFTESGIPDIVSTDGVHLGTGDGTFEAPLSSAPLVDLSPYEYATGIAVGDLGGDGNLDVAFVLTGSAEGYPVVSISLGNGNGTFRPATTIALPAGSGAGGIVAGDFLGNGRTDLAVAAGAGVTIILSNGDGTFQVLPQIAVAQGAVSITEGDFENNGRVDLAVAAGSDVTILSNLGGGQFKAAPVPSWCPASLRGCPPSLPAISARGFSTWPWSTMSTAWSTS